MKKWLLTALCVLAAWLVFAKPDWDAENNKTRQLLSTEAALRSQALTGVMEKHRLAAVLLARSGIMEQIIQHPNPGEALADRIRYLQALTGVRDISVLRRFERNSFPQADPPARLVQSGQWARAVGTAFQGSLGRAFFVDDENSPTYLFFAPHFDTGGQPSAVIITTIDLGIVADSWQVSANRVALYSSEGELIIQNNVGVPENAIYIERQHIQLGATLRVAAAPPSFFGDWWFRSALIGMFVALAGLLISRQAERRRFLTELAEQQASEASRLEAEVTQRTQELENAQQQLMQTEKLALLGQMSASISHEINQPLAALKNYASTAIRLLDKDKAQEAGDNLERISRLTDRISRVVVNLRSFASNEPSPIQPVDVTSVVQEALSELGDRFPEAIEVCRFEQSDASSHEFALAGRIRLLQVLGNLLTNAWYACRNEVQPSITVSLIRQTDSLSIRVWDNGPGFGNELGEKAFDAFVSARDDENGSNDGMGLGLSISRSFIESMSGSLTLESDTASGPVLLIQLQNLTDQ